MAKVTYRKLKAYWSSDATIYDNGSALWGANLLPDGEIISPVVECSQAEFNSLYPNAEFGEDNDLGYATSTGTFAPPTQSVFKLAMGIDLGDIVQSSWNRTQDTFIAIYEKYFHILPAIGTKRNGFSFSPGSAIFYGPIFMLAVPDKNYDGVEFQNYSAVSVTPYPSGYVASLTDVQLESGPGSYYGASGAARMIPLPGVAANYFRFRDNTILVNTYVSNIIYNIKGGDYAYIASVVINLKASPVTPTVYLYRFEKNYPGVANYSRFINLLLNSDKVVPTYALNVANGTGAGNYRAGDSVTVVAQPPNEGDVFAHWEFSYEVDIQYGGLNTAAVSFIMPSMAITATAVFISSESDMYSLTVQNGSGTGIYAENADVTIVANKRENLYFAHWDVSVVGTVDSDFSINWTYGGPNTASASFKMPAKNLVIYAAYVNDGGNFPYAGGGASTPSGGGGSWTTPDNGVGSPDLPSASTSAANAGMVTMYSPTLSELQALGEFLWSDNFILDFADNIKKLFTNPMDCIISLHIMPYPAPTLSEAQEVRFGMIGSGVSMKRITTQYVAHDCGSIEIPNFSGSFLDYTPHTKYSLFLPFIGSVQLDADEITGKSLNVKYHIDLLTGACVAFVSADSVLIASYNGQCSNPVPVSGANYSRLIASIIGVVGGATIAGLSMGAAGAVSAGASAAQAVSATNSVSRLASAFNETGHWGKGLPGIADVRSQLREAMATANSAASAPPEHLVNSTRSSANRLIVAHTISSTVNNIMGSKGQVQHSGSMGGSTGFLGKRTPYLTITRPRQSIPNNYGHFYGYPSNISGTLASFTGFTVFDVMEATSITGTDGEMDELIELLKGGVYL